jgi:hypothetical protein
MDDILQTQNWMLSGKQNALLWLHLSDALLPVVAQPVQSKTLQHEKMKQLTGDALRVGAKFAAAADNR